MEIRTSASQDPTMHYLPKRTSTLLFKQMKWSGDLLKAYLPNISSSSMKKKKKKRHEKRP